MTDRTSYPSVLQTAQTALTGKWQGKTGGSGQAVVLDVTDKGTALTGTLTLNGETSKIQALLTTPAPRGPLASNSITAADAGAAQGRFGT